MAIGALDRMSEIHPALRMAKAVNVGNLPLSCPQERPHGARNLHTTDKLQGGSWPFRIKVALTDIGVARSKTSNENVAVQIGWDRQTCFPVSSKDSALIGYSQSSSTAFTEITSILARKVTKYINDK